MIRQSTLLATAAASASLFVAGCGGSPEALRPTNTTPPPAETTPVTTPEVTTPEATTPQGELASVLNPAIQALGATAVEYAKKHSELTSVFVGDVENEEAAQEFPGILKLRIAAESDPTGYNEVTVTFKRDGDSMALDPTQITAVEINNQDTQEDDSNLGTDIKLIAPGSNIESAESDAVWDAIADTWIIDELTDDFEIADQRQATLGTIDEAVHGKGRDVVTIANSIIEDAPDLLDATLKNITLASLVDAEPSEEPAVVDEVGQEETPSGNEEDLEVTTPKNLDGYTDPIE